MRLRVVCEGTTARYRVEARRDGRILLDDTVRGAGARYDRPMYLLREVRLPPGPTRLEVRVTQIDRPLPSPDTTEEAQAGDSAGALAPGGERRETEERQRRRLEAIPATLVFDSAVRLGPARSCW